MHDYFSEMSLRTSFDNVQLNDVNRPAMSVNVVDRDRLSLDLTSSTRARVVSLSDLALEALSPVYSTAVIDSGTRTGTMMTPTPTQFLFPKSVTAEQEAYASGFAQALEEIYRAQGRPNNDMLTVGNCGVWPPSSVNVNHTSTLHYIPQSSFGTLPDHQQTIIPTVTSTLSSASMPSTVMFPISTNSVSSYLSAVNPMNSFAGMNASTVSAMGPISSGLCVPSVNSTNSFLLQPTASSSHLPDLDGSTGSSGSPRLTVDMEEQDRWRLERKRAKNRVAAARCQMRKLERISKLEDKARDLRNYNLQLAQTAASLHEQVSKLQKQILSHTERGCRLLIPSIQ